MPVLQVWVWVIVWGGSLWLLLEYWPLWLLAFVLFVVSSVAPALAAAKVTSQIWMGTDHRERTLEDGLSAYSIFNPFQVRLEGTLTAEDLTSQMMGFGPARRAQPMNVGSAFDRQEAAQSERELEAAIQASLQERPHHAAAVPDDDDDPALRAAIEASLRER